MSLAADQAAAFQANGGFQPSDVSTAVLSVVFAVFLVWGAWAVRTAYVGWAEQQLSGGQFVMVFVRFVAMFVVLTFFLLS